MQLLVGIGITMFIVAGLIAGGWITARSLRLRSGGFFLGALALFATANILAFSGAFEMSYCASESCQSNFNHLLAAVLLAAPGLGALVLLHKTEKTMMERNG